MCAEKYVCAESRLIAKLATSVFSMCGGEAGCHTDGGDGVS